jgi:putative metalloprotease
LVFVLARVLPGVGPLVANLLTSLVAARLSRADEFAADAWASALLIKAGIGTGPQISLFQKLDRLTATGGARPPEWLMSHPTTDRRIAAISANVAKWGAGA